MYLSYVILAHFLALLNPSFPSVLLDVDSTDPTILRQDINDLRWASQNDDERMYWYVRTETERLQNQINTLDTTVRTLQGEIDELNAWKAKSETEQGTLDQRLIENYAEFTDKVSQVGNRIRTLDSVVLKHHPASHSDLGYQFHEETTYIPTTEEVPSSTPIVVEHLPAVEEVPSLSLEVVIPQ
jgi:hypothetical protein